AAEGRAHRGLPDRDDRAFADVAQRVTETDRGRGLAFAEWGGRDGRDHDVLCLGLGAQLVDRVELDLRHVVAVWLEQVRADPHLGSDLRHREHSRFARDLEDRKSTRLNSSHVAISYAV